MSAHRSIRLLHTFTRDQLTRALAAAGHSSIAEGLYARPDHEVGRSCLALDFDDPGDLGLLIIVISKMLTPADAEIFGMSTDTGMPAHPNGDHSGLRAAWWRGFRLDEPTLDEWTDEISDCGACRWEDHGGPDCLTHDRAPWERPYTLTVP